MRRMVLGFDLKNELLNLPFDPYAAGGYFGQYKMMKKS